MERKKLMKIAKELPQSQTQHPLVAAGNPFFVVAFSRPERARK
jgi:hypothetical protein